MKKLIHAGFILGILFLFTSESNAQRPETQVVLADSTHSLSYPLSVANIIGTKCIGCHSPGSRNEKAREKLMWINLQSMHPVDLVAFAEEMHEVLEEGSMPPKKMLERFPQAKLTDEEVASLKTWIKSVETKLMDE